MVLFFFFNAVVQHFGNKHGNAAFSNICIYTVVWVGHAHLFKIFERAFIFMGSFDLNYIKRPEINNFLAAFF